MKKTAAAVIIGAACLAALFALLPKPAPPPSGTITVVATIFPFADWAREVGGEHVTVLCLLKAGTSPHTYEPLPRHVRTLAGASLILSNGLGLDDWLDKLVEASGNRAARHITLGEMFEPLTYRGIRLTVGSGHGHDDNAAHHHHEAPCGMWLDPAMAEKMVTRIADELAAIDPAHTAYYHARRDAYIAKLRALDEKLASALTPHHGRKIVTFHNVYLYLAARYRIDIAAVVEEFPGREPSLKDLRNIITLCRREKIGTVFSEPQLSKRGAGVLAKEIGGAVEELDPIGGVEIPGRNSYLALMEYNLAQLLKGMQ